MNEKMLSVREVARAAGRSEETVRRWIWSGKLRATKLGNQLFVQRKDLDAMLAPRTGEAALAYRASTSRPTLFDEYDYSPLQEALREHRGQVLPSSSEEAEHIAEDEAFQDEILARFGDVDVMSLLDRDR